MEGGLHLGTTARQASLALIVKQAHVALAGSDGDGFLASVLPAQGLSTELDFTIGWSSRTGVHFGGHAGLDAYWPLTTSIGPLTLGALRLVSPQKTTGICACCV